MRKIIVAGNWKMNKDRSSITSFIDAMPNSVSDSVGVYVFPSTIYLDRCSAQVKSSRKAMSVGAQNFYFEEKGAFTGEVSVSMLRDNGISVALVGHSERRQYFQESNAVLSKKLDAAINQDVHAFYCVGETLEERESGQAKSVIQNQLDKVLKHRPANQFDLITVAYEPVWAIGTGRTASPEDAQEMHAFIRNILNGYHDQVGEQTHILYGGSVKPSNADQLFAQNDIDGGLIGGASLKSEDFLSIISIAERL